MTKAASGLPERIGRYEVELQLGQGRYARVLIARDPVLGRQVAVKILRDDLSLDAAARTLWTGRLKEGARTAAALHTPGVLVVHDMGDDERVGPFVVLELVHGSSLRERLAQGRLSRSEVIHLARSLGSTLTQVHAAGVVHGNIKPENVLLSPAGPKLTDFGAVLVPAHDGPGSAAESAERLAGGSVGGTEADQFSLAALLYEAATGAPPFPGEGTRAAAGSAKATRYPAATSIDPDLRVCPGIDGIFERGLSSDPWERFGSCEALCGALASSLEAAQSPPFTPTTQSSIVPRLTRQWQNAAAAAAVVVIFALVLLGREPRPEGVSLRSVATAFASTIAPPEAAPSVSRRAAPAPSPSSAVLPVLSGNSKPAARMDGGPLTARFSGSEGRDPPATGDRSPSPSGDRVPSVTGDRSPSPARDRSLPGIGGPGSPAAADRD
jgi:eukaryotic-like serine/threonine-protein kinase